MLGTLFLAARSIRRTRPTWLSIVTPRIVRPTPAGRHPQDAARQHAAAQRRQDHSSMRQGDRSHAPGSQTWRSRLRPADTGHMPDLPKGIHRACRTISALLPSRSCCPAAARHDGSSGCSDTYYDRQADDFADGRSMHGESQPHREGDRSQAVTKSASEQLIAFDVQHQHSDRGRTLPHQQGHPTRHKRRPALAAKLGGGGAAAFAGLTTGGAGAAVKIDAEELIRDRDGKN